MLVAVEVGRALDESSESSFLNHFVWRASMTLRPAFTATQGAEIHQVLPELLTSGILMPEKLKYNKLRLTGS